MKTLFALALLSLSVVAHAMYGGGNDVLMSNDPFWLYLVRLWNGWDGFTL